MEKEVRVPRTRAHQPWPQARFSLSRLLCDRPDLLDADSTQGRDIASAFNPASRERRSEIRNPVVSRQGVHPHCVWSGDACSPGSVSPSVLHAVDSIVREQRDLSFSASSVVRKARPFLVAVRFQALLALQAARSGVLGWPVGRRFGITRAVEKQFTKRKHKVNN